ncbi:MAG: hypothetical protein DI529_10130 [Chryseobacterium sp.]|nr:MAG: hypothetical protein DI529_10130 [Chryseobacterium sp.]
MEKVTAKASIGIQKSVSEVFEAIVNPEIMQNYFISEGSGRMETHKEIFWSFPEFDGSYPLTTKEITPNEKKRRLICAFSIFSPILQNQSWF